MTGSGRGTAQPSGVWGQTARCPPRLVAGFSPGVGCPHSQLFAVQHSGYLQSLPSYVQSCPQEHASTTLAVGSHRR